MPLPANLKNGSDIRGVATEGVAGEPVNLTPDTVRLIAAAFVNWLSDRLSRTPDQLIISVGRDSRISGPVLMDACLEGITAAGPHALNCGLASTPAMFMSTLFEETQCDGAIMLTASHLPYNRNGMKFFTREGGLQSGDITELLRLAGEDLSLNAPDPDRIQEVDLIGLYSGFLTDTIRQRVNHPVTPDQPLLGFHIVVDAGNGSGGFFATQVLKPLGANIEGSQFLEPDGYFPNHVPNPEDNTAMGSIRKAVLDNHADLGIIFDTDVDRAAVVDSSGAIINRNALIALISAIVLEEHPGTTIVTDSITSDGLSQFITGRLKGRHHRFKRGYKNVINEAVRLNEEGTESWLAIETSGHAALRENRFLDDGAYLVTRILIKAAQLRSEGKDIRSLIRDLVHPAESREYRIRLNATDFITQGNTVIRDLETFAATIPGWTIVPDNYEGIRVACDERSGNGWFLLRLSLHDPVMPLNVESAETGGVERIMEVLSGFLERYAEL